MSSLRSQMRYMNPYDVHKALINEYILKRPGDTKLLSRDTSKDRTDYDVLRDNHRFLWDDKLPPDTWEAQFAKKYYDKLFKEYCIGDLTLYKENKVALRWRIEREVISGKGQFICGNKKCEIRDDLKTWEVNFAYREHGEKKNALVKIRLCHECSLKLNYHSKKREIKRIDKHKVKRIKKTKKKRSKDQKESDSGGEGGSISSPTTSNIDKNDTDDMDEDETEETAWEKHKPVEMKSRDEEMEEYLHDLLL